MGRLRKQVQAAQVSQDVKDYLTEHVDAVQKAADAVMDKVDNFNHVFNNGFNDNRDFADEFLNYDVVDDTRNFTRNMYFGMIGHNNYSCSQENIIGVDDAIRAAQALVDKLKEFKAVYTRCGDRYFKLDSSGFFNGLYPDD
jgi:hypothetical protein